MNLRAIEVLIALNVIVFVFTVADESLFAFFALTPRYFLSEPWTVITSMFTHLDFDHLLFNMLGLFFLGSYLEVVIGERRFLKIYFIGGLVGGILSVVADYMGLYDPQTLTVMVGASGAIFAVAACLAILRPHLTVFLFFIIPMPLYIAVFGFMLLMSFIPGVAWSGHLGGLMVGAIAGYYLKKKGVGYQQPGSRYGHRFY